MKKMTILLGITLSVAYLPVAEGQIINQDASGKSSIVTPGTSINLNITETQIQGTHYGTFGANKNGIYGFDVTAKNSSGVANLFDAGKFLPGGAVAGLIGFKHTTFTFADNSRQEYVDALNRLVALRNNFGPAYLAEVRRGVTVPSLDTADQRTVVNELGGLDQKGLENLPDNLLVFKSSITDTNKVTVITALVKKLLVFVTDKKDEIAALKNQINLLKQLHPPAEIKNSTNIWYFRSGVSATQFTYDLGSTFKDYNKRFMDTTAKNYFFEFGLSRQFQRNFLGVTFGFNHQSNMASLTSADYTYNYQDTSVTSGKLTKQKAFTAYSGAYGFYGRVYCNLDYQHLITVDTSKYLAVGPYLRWSHNLNAGELAKDATVLGLSINYLNGKAGAFLGGIYLQSSDISGRTEKNFGKSIQFGLVAKFNLGSIFVLK